MAKIVATAEVTYFDGSAWPDTRITKQKADRFTMYAPGWRPMAFTSEQSARAKLEKHPGFRNWR